MLKIVRIKNTFANITYLSFFLINSVCCVCLRFRPGVRFAVVTSLAGLSAARGQDRTGRGGGRPAATFSPYFPLLFSLKTPSSSPKRTERASRGRRAPSPAGLRRKGSRPPRESFCPALVTAAGISRGSRDGDSARITGK